MIMKLAHLKLLYHVRNPQRKRGTEVRELAVSTSTSVFGVGRVLASSSKLSQYTSAPYDKCCVEYDWASAGRRFPGIY